MGSFASPLVDPAVGTARVNSAGEGTAVALVRDRSVAGAAGAVCAQIITVQDAVPTSTQTQSSLWVVIAWYGSRRDRPGRRTRLKLPKKEQIR